MLIEKNILDTFGPVNFIIEAPSETEPKVVLGGAILGFSTTLDIKKTLAMLKLCVEPTIAEKCLAESLKQ